MAAMKEKAVLVTGGASGIGEAAVRRFVDAGSRVLVADLDAERGRELERELGGDLVTFRQVDVTDQTQVANAVHNVVDRWGRIDVLFANAGATTGYGRLEDLTAEDFDVAYRLLVIGPFLAMKSAVPYMKKAGGGSVVVTASTAGMVGGWGPHPYTAAKTAAIGLVRSAAGELAQYKIRVNAISPGGTITPMNLRAMGGGPEAREMLQEYLRGLHPLDRAGEPEDMASAALWLASDEASFITGVNLAVDGGATATLRWDSSLEGTSP